jgi:16S rRNA (uracil1498-N3)-methyltransferase
MTLHRFLVPAERRQDARVEFTAEQAHQLKSVLRLKAGDRVRVFDAQRPCDSLVELVSWTEGRVLDELSQPAEPLTRLVAYPALLPRDKFENVLQKLTEVGVSAIVPVITQRSLVREPPDEHRLERWRAILREATEQSGRGRLPELSRAQAFGQAIAGAPGTPLLAYAAEPGASLRTALAHRPETVALFVGPEGDFESAEVAQARQAGAWIVTLGPRILRAETASPVLAALVLYELERRSSGP